MGKAKSLCPELVTIPYDFEGYNEVSKLLYDIVARYIYKSLWTTFDILSFVIIYFWEIFIVISISLVCFIHAWILEEKNDSFHTHMKLNMSCTEILCNYKKNVGVNNFTNINKANNHLLPQLMELKKDHNIWCWKLWSWLGRG